MRFWQNSRGPFLWVACLLMPVLLGTSTDVPGAYAYTGGPALVEVLGWDAASQRVYLWEHTLGETGEFGAVTYLSADSAETRVAWSRPNAPDNDPGQAGMLAGLRSRLEPMSPSAAPVLSKSGITVTGVDSVRTAGGMRAAFRLRVAYEVGLTFECRSATREFAVKDVYRIPGTQSQLFVVVFRGNFNDGLLAETQVPVVVRASGQDQVVSAIWIPAIAGR